MNKGKMNGDRKRRKSNKANASLDTQDTEKSIILEEHGAQLLPGIPDELTLENITTRLPWRMFFMLSAVSRSWKQAIQSRQIHDSRVRSQSTQTLVVINHIDSECINRIALYSLKDKSCYRLPSIPHLDGGIPWFCQCITLDGKIYILGGRKDHTRLLGSDRVYVLDLVGQCKWRQCASMQEARQKFACGVINGKIYVFGGTSLGAPVCGSEVYDPTVDAWSAIKPMTSWRFNHEVAAVGEELVVYSGKVFNPIHRYQTRNRGFGYQGPYSDHIMRPFARDLEAYHPGKDKWRLLSKGLLKYPAEKVFMAQGKFHSMTGSVIYVYDIEKKTRTQLHSSSFAAIEPVRTQPYGVLALDDELLAAQLCWEDESTYGTFLIQSRGLGGEDKKIVWEKAPCSLSDVHSLMCPVRL